jgi:hypothetical protein
MLISTPGRDRFWRSGSRSWSQSQPYRSRNFNLKNNSKFTTRRATIPTKVERLNAIRCCMHIIASKRKFTYLNFGGYFVSTLHSVVIVNSLVTVGLKASSDMANNG